MSRQVTGRTGARVGWLAMGAILAFSSVSQADFLGLEIEELDDVSIGFDTDLAVYRIYATFSNPTDSVLSAGGSTISTTAPGGFWKAPMSGGWLAPNQTIVNLFPETEWDSFVTVGLAVDDGSNSTALDPDFKAAGGSLEGGWFNANPSNPNAQANPDADGRVLIMQLTLNAGQPSMTEGNMFLFWKPQGPGGAQAENVNFKFEVIPGPGAAAFLVAGAVFGGRRRRRS